MKKRVKYKCAKCETTRQRLEKNVVIVDGKKYCAECVEPEKVELWRQVFVDNPIQDRGRPKGASNKSILVHVAPPCCPRCESTKSKVIHTRSKDIDGVLPLGRTYNQITWKRVQCLDCPQIRMEKHFESYKITTE